jgi:TRAP-type C4-dicarboxylate transport system permease large subunit
MSRSVFENILRVIRVAVRAVVERPRQPFGATLFVSCSLTGKSIRETTPFILPIVLSMLVVLLLITFFPAVVLWIPEEFR